ncbi:MAG: FAD-dependent oxidoreductase [Lachnospiraceae bacterium]|nr:FAD-dependent oxidoreductase [Lachnospiraceae bacterium]
MSKNYLEPAAEIPVFDECEVLVVGGGAAGHSAAIAAARAGCKNVVLMERYGYMGGDVTGGYVIMVPDLSWYEKSFVRGLQEEWFTRLEAIPGAVRGPAMRRLGSTDPLLVDAWKNIHDCVSRNVNSPNRLVRAVYFEPNQLKIELDKMLLEERDRIRVYCHCWGTKPIVENSQVKGVIFESKEGRRALMARIVIDATGDGDLYSQTGAPYFSLILKFAPALILMFSLLESIRDVCGYEKNDSFMKFMMLGIYMACMGNYALPFMGIQLTTIGMANSVMGEYQLAFSNLTYFLTTVILLALWLLVYTVMLGKVFKVNLKPLRDLDVAKVESLKEISDHFNKRQIILIIAFFFCVADLVVTSVWPHLPGIGALTSLGAIWIWLVVIAVLSIFKVDDEPILVPQAILKDTMWVVVTMIGAFSMLGSAMAAEEYGIRTWIVQLISPIFGNMSLPVMIILVVVVITFATNFLNGLPLTLACVASVLPFVCQMQVERGVSATVMVTLFGICANLAYLTATGSVYSSLIISREEIDAKWLWTKGLIVLAGFMVVASVVGIILSYILP